MAIYQDNKTGRWYYNYQMGGKRHHGACKGCTTRREAERYEKELRRVNSDVAKITATDALFEARRRELTGHDGLPLSEAFDRAVAKPGRGRAKARQIEQKRGAFADFIAFMRDTAPDVADIAAVTKAHAEAYISHIQSNGKYISVVKYVRDGKTIVRPSRGAVAGDTEESTTSNAPSDRTVKFYLTTCCWVFRSLMEDAGISKNPFDGIKVSAANTETREAFTDAELRLIYDNLDSFTRPLFTTAICTGLREGDICTLRRGEVDILERIIRRKTRKTGARIEIPIMDELLPILTERMSAAEQSEYIFPELAEEYLRNPSGISRKIKAFLGRLGIITTRVPEGRSRAVSVKDLHSCRHTFCYMMARAGVPLPVVQGIVGHLTPEMTKYYSNHATMEDKRSGMAALSGGFSRTLGNDTTTDRNSIEPERAELLRIVQTADIELVKKLLKVAKE